MQFSDYSEDCPLREATLSIGVYMCGVVGAGQCNETRTSMSRGCTMFYFLKRFVEIATNADGRAVRQEILDTMIEAHDKGDDSGD